MYQGPAVFPDTIPSAASTSSGVNLTRAWSRMFLSVPTMSTSATLTMQISQDGGTTFYNAFNAVPNTSSIQINLVQISTNVGASGGVVELPCGGPYVRFLAGAAVNNGVVFKIICQSD